MFGFTDINLNEFLIAMALAFSVIPTSEIIKFFQRRRLTKEAA
jgi:hypothetical protein